MRFIERHLNNNQLCIKIKKLSKPDVYLYECGRCKHKVSRQITIEALLSMFEMTEGINHIRSRVFIVPGILVLNETKMYKYCAGYFGT